MLGAWALCAAVAAASPAVPTVQSFVDAYGAPSKSIDETARVKSPDEPLMLYWMQTKAAPLGVGPALPGTLVANFSPRKALPTSPLSRFTFLAMAGPAEEKALIDALRAQGAIRGDTVVARRGGKFRELSVVLPGGTSGTVALRLDSGGPAMADGRPAPTLWMDIRRP